MQYFEKSGNDLIFRGNGETLMISPWGKNSLRVRSCILRDIESGVGALLDAEPGECEITVDSHRASIQNGKIRAELSAKKWDYGVHISFKSSDGKVLLQEITSGGAMHRRARQFKPLQGGSFRLKASFIPEKGEKIYGMGQYQQEIMDLKGCSLELAQRNTQASVPFYISSIGYGFLWNNPAIGEVHFGTNETQWVAEQTKQLDYWITAGDSPAEIERAYAAATGKAPMMPEHGLSFWQCKLRYFNQEQVLAVAREYKKRNIPLDVLVIDFYHWFRCGDWKFDAEYFPDPMAMVRELHDIGIEPMVSFWPVVDERSENYHEMKQLGLLVKNVAGIVDVQKTFNGDNVFMDPTNPRTREYVWNKVKENYASLGIRAFWLDEAEPSFQTYDFEQYRYHAGTVAEIGNIYPREYARLFYEGLRVGGQKDVVSLIRCAWAGSQRYGALVWSGDVHSTYEDFRRQICAGIHMGLSGIPWWTTDIGGFSGGNIEDPAFRELLVRWFQFGTFCPVMRLHGDRKPFAPITNKAGESREHTGADNEVWSFGDENYPILVKFIGIRELMRDYTRDLMKTAHEKGDPVIRALFYEFPTDQACWDVSDEYMFGTDILVAPICHKGAMSRTVYLPQGARWTHAGTGEILEGGQTYEIDAPIDTLPIFLRDGKQDYLIGKV